MALPASKVEMSAALRNDIRHDNAVQCVRVTGFLMLDRRYSATPPRLCITLMRILTVQVAISIAGVITGAMNPAVRSGGATYALYQLRFMRHIPLVEFPISRHRPWRAFQAAP